MKVKENCNRNKICIHKHTCIVHVMINTEEQIQYCGITYHFTTQLATSIYSGSLYVIMMPLGLKKDLCWLFNDKIITGRSVIK